MDDRVLGSVLIARHGETESNVVRRYAGWCPEGLTSPGLRQAAALGAELQDRGITRIRSSEIRRAMSTAEVVGQRLGLPVIGDCRLNELRMGPWEGLTEAEVAERFPREYGIWLERPDELRLDGRETLPELAERVGAVLRDSVESGHNELLITHVALVRVAVLIGAQDSLRAYKQVPVVNCQWFQVKVWANGVGNTSAPLGTGLRQRV